MKATLVIAAVLQIVGALLIGVSCKFSLGPQQPTGCTYQNIALMVLLFASGMGLLLHKNWGRVMSIILASGVVVTTLHYVICLTIFSLNALSSETQGTLIGVLLLFWCGSLFFIAIAIWWLWASEHPRMMTLLFQPPGQRPGEITFIAAWSMYALSGFLNLSEIRAFPFMGAILEGWKAQTLLGLWMSIWVLFGIGLWYLKRWAWVGSLVMLGLEVVSDVVTLWVPGAYENLIRLDGRFYRWGSIIFTLGLGIVFLYFLIIRRAAFRKTS